MDLGQKKLTAVEWDALEVPVHPDEERILNMVSDGYDNVNIGFNEADSLIGFIKIKETPVAHQFLYDKYLKKGVHGLVQKYKLTFLDLSKKGKNKKKGKGKSSTLKTADAIRVKNADKKLHGLKERIFEFVVLDTLIQFLKGYKKGRPADYHFYTMTQLMRFNVTGINPIFSEQVHMILDHYEPKMDKLAFIKMSPDFIEKNPILSRYRDVNLYSHQKQLFTHCKRDRVEATRLRTEIDGHKEAIATRLAGGTSPEGLPEKVAELERQLGGLAKLILYQAPTGTGKTISPIGLAKAYRVIFVCVAKHVGLQLAKACISMKLKIAVAFGCSDPGGIRLHYYAAKECQRNWRTGGIFRVDNSVGDNVEVMITDLQSYLPAMRYMLAFNAKEDIILYWDEPTITLDREEHEYHALLSRNWRENEIPNIVLSSATLPSQEEIGGCIQSFMVKFNSTNVYEIISHDCAKTIPLLDANGYIVLPHYLFETRREMKDALRHIKRYQTLLRHFDLGEVTKFIVYTNSHTGLADRYKVHRFFETVKDIDALSLKQYYITLLGALKDEYDAVYVHFKAQRTKLYESSILITTADAHTLTDGPTIYLAGNVERIGQFCMHKANIPIDTIATLMDSIGFNEEIRIQVADIERDIQKITDGQAEAGANGSSSKDNRDTDKANAGKQQALQKKIDFLRTHLRPVRLPTSYIPNSFDHLRRWDHQESTRAFVSDIDESIVEKIMLLDVVPLWKVLLLMGIGVFAEHKCADYVSIMKGLAEEQKLYLIIASTDYIYGTNYQFCHGYIGKDLADLTQEKTIQAFGRIGRSNARQDYSIRVRNQALIRKLFTKAGDKIEVRNMNRLFSLVEPVQAVAEE